MRGTTRGEARMKERRRIRREREMMEKREGLCGLSLGFDRGCTAVGDASVDGGTNYFGKLGSSGSLGAVEGKLSRRSYYSMCSAGYRWVGKLCAWVPWTDDARAVQWVEAALVIVVILV